MPVRAFSALTELAPKTDGKPTVVGPYSSMYEGSVPTIRTIGFRRAGKVAPPILHAKLASSPFWAISGGTTRTE
jgi:hypothetical protein